MASRPSTDTALPTAFPAFFKWCQAHLRARGWGHLDEAAARYLRTWVHVQQGNASTAAAIKRLLDAVPKSRITKSRLIEAAALGDDAGEAEWVLPTGTDLRGLPTDQMRTILADRRINGRVQFLTSRVPTWEPAVNPPSNEIHIYRRRQRHRVELA
ncbi:hypothetical protein F442_10200 [Phytophthora nicotianae P10297]|uniref:Uncharacterized protein n=1 Tax=Phytophthora nicotianae P10297 TaxID=1317064 RepID=W2Z6C7_PHYNI|nr:hypothetical protein F442_10200 [Phytophthora nicotianae P10297]